MLSSSRWFLFFFFFFFYLNDDGERESSMGRRVLCRQWHCCGCESTKWLVCFDEWHVKCVYMRSQTEHEKKKKKEIVWRSFSHFLPTFAVAVVDDNGYNDNEIIFTSSRHRCMNHIETFLSEVPFFFICRATTVTSMLTFFLFCSSSSPLSLLSFQSFDDARVTITKGKRVYYHGCNKQEG